jgi:aryl-phospho-beta-D-glucosidase BglC (GH1 family)
LKRSLAFTWAATLCLAFQLYLGTGWAQTQAGSTSSPAPAKNAVAKAPANGASSADIAAAKSAGKVWVNTESKVYHKGGRWYGKTKKGQFMTEDEAKKAGYKAAKSGE